MHAWESSALVELTGLLLLAARALGARCVRHARESERANARVSKVREILIGTYGAGCSTQHLCKAATQNPKKRNRCVAAYITCIRGVREGRVASRAPRSGSRRGTLSSVLFFTL